MSCTNLDTGFNLPKTYYQWFQSVSPTQPEYFPEFEGGWFQPWGGYFFDQCLAEQSPEFADVFYKGLIAQRATLLNLYMAFGGTNWGHIAAPVVSSELSPLDEADKNTGLHIVRLRRTTTRNTGGPRQVQAIQVACALHSCKQGTAEHGDGKQRYF